MLVKKIDIHVHCALEKEVPRFWGDGDDFATPDEMRVMWDRWGIEKGLQLPVITSDHTTHPLTNQEAMHLVEQHPDMFYWFCNIDPRWGENNDKTDHSQYLNWYKARGAKGVGEITSNMYFDDPIVWNLFRHAEKCEMPILFHIGNMGSDYGLVDELGLPRLEKTLKEFPNLLFIGHSQKFWAEISGDCTEEGRNGYPEGKVTPGGRVVELLDKYPNLHGDLSAGSGGNAIMRDEEFGLWFLEKYQDRLYFGTDICSPKNVFLLPDYLDECVKSGKLSETAYNKICRENALRLLEGK